MESIIARALEYTLKYWLKSFSRDQFKLQGRTAQLSNLDINGDALHASMGLPPALNVTTARVGKLEIMLPYVSNVQIEPIIVQIDRLDLVLEENPDAEACKSPSSAQSSTSSGKGSGYGYADKIADGMTLQVQTVNLLLETRGGAKREGAAWASPLASITIRNLLLYTTNENWEAVNLKEARDFSTNKGFIYLFKKLEWEALSIDLLPHPDMFADAFPEEQGNQRDEDGAKRVFFGGERFLEGISGQAYITVQRTELNRPLGLEVQLHIPEALCPALSEPGLRALLRFMTGFYVCLNRGDVDPKAQKGSTEAAGRSLVSVLVDHIFLCIKDSEFRLELLMQSLFFSRACVSDGEKASYLSKVIIGGLFLRDTFTRPPCTLVQPSMHSASEEVMIIPEFGKNFCPPIYPLDDHRWQLLPDVPLICLHSLQIKPSPNPPQFASKTVIRCQPLMIYLQEEACMRISSFLADGIVVNPGVIIPDSSVDSLLFTLKELSITVPLDTSKLKNYEGDENLIARNPFAGARLHVEQLSFSQSPSLKVKLLNLEKDPACFCLWPGQPIDASQKKWSIGASYLSLCLETSTSLKELQNTIDWTSGLWKCVELKDVCFDAAMFSADGKPLTLVPPPGGVVRIGFACQQYLSNTSVDQLFFVLDLYTYLGNVSEKIAAVGKGNELLKSRSDTSSGKLMEKVPSDTAVSFALNDLQLKFLEPSSLSAQGMPLVQFIGRDLFMKVSHRTLGGAVAVSFSLCWEGVQVDCVDTEGTLPLEKGNTTTTQDNGVQETCNGYLQLKPVFWVYNRRKKQSGGSNSMIPFLELSTVHVIPFSELDRGCHSLSISACISGVRLGGGMSYAEALLHRFGILGPDGGPGEGLSRGLENVSAGPLSKFFKSSIIDDIKKNGMEQGENAEDGKDSGFSQLGKPDDVDVSIELRDWLFALEGAEEMSERWGFYNQKDVSREERCWHTTFRSLRAIAKSKSKHDQNGTEKPYAEQNFPVESFTVGVEGLQTLKPQAHKGAPGSFHPVNGANESAQTSRGINVEAQIVASTDTADYDIADWVVENLKFSVEEPIEAVVTKDELQRLGHLCKSEIDSMGRIAAGLLRVLKLEHSIGRTALDQLSNLGSEGFDKVFSPRPSTGSSPGCFAFSPSSKLISDTRVTEMESTVDFLEDTILETQAKCAVLISDLTTSQSSTEQLDSIKQLGQKLESMQSLVARLRTQI